MMINISQLINLFITLIFVIVIRVLPTLIIRCYESTYATPDKIINTAVLITAYAIVGSFYVQAHMAKGINCIMFTFPLKCYIGIAVLFILFIGFLCFRTKVITHSLLFLIFTLIMVTYYKFKIYKSLEQPYL